MNKANGNLKASRPQWSLVMKDRQGRSDWVSLGVGWDTEQGGISLKLDSKVIEQLTHDGIGLAELADRERRTLTLFRGGERRVRRPREFGNWPAGDPRNCQAGETMAEFFARRRREVQGP